MPGQCSIFRDRCASTFGRAFAIFMLAVVGSAAEQRAEPDENPSDLYVLPPLEVTAPVLDSRKKWLHGSLGNLHVLSTLSQAHIKRALHDTLVFRDFAGQFGREFSPRANSEVWMVLANDADHIQLFAKDHEKDTYSTIIADTVFIFTHFENRPTQLLERTIRRKWISAIYQADFPDSPLWLNWANSKILGDMEISGERITFGRILGDQQFFLDKLSPVPLKDMFAIRRTLAPSLSRYSGGKDRFIATRQAAAFMHFCLWGSKGKYAAAFQKIREKGRQGVVDEQDFIAAFEINFDAMEKLIHNYTNGLSTRFETHRYRIKGGNESDMAIALCTPEELNEFERRFRGTPKQERRLE